MCSYHLSNSSHPNFFSSSGKKNPPTSSPRILVHSSHVGLALNSVMSVGYNVSSGSLAFRIGHASAYHSKLGYGLSIMFRGLKNLSIPTHFSLLLDKLCSWHPNYGIEKLISDVFSNRIISQNPSFSSCKHMFHLTPLKPYQIQSAR